MNVAEDPLFRNPGQDIGKGGRFQPRSFGNRAIEAAKEGVTVVRIIFPGIFPIKDNRNDTRPANAPPDLLEPADEVGNRPFRFPLGIGEADQVGKRVVAKKEIQLLPPLLKGIWLIERLPCRTDAAGKSVGQDPLIAGSPAKAAVG